jgi:hypothetical protein
VGRPVDGQPPQESSIVVATRDPTDAHSWMAKLPLPAGAPTATVTAQVVNGVGLIRTETTMVTLLSPAQAALGRVAGAVTEGVLPQPGLAVQLRDENQSPVAAVSTNARGEFLFEAVKPGKYLVWSVKEQSQRVGAAAVEVEAGATAKAEVQLSL